MTEVFVSHVDADADAAGRLADALDAAGLPAWGGRAGDPDGVTALDTCRVFVLLASPSALGSARVHDEVVRAHERGIPFVPVLAGISHLELGARQPAWRTALGSATAIEVPPEGVVAIAPRVVAGVRSLAAQRRPPGRSARVGPLAALAAVVLAVTAALVWWLVGRGDDTDGANAGSGSSQDVSPGATSSAPAVADSLTTLLKTAVGDLTIMQTAFATEFCAAEEDCVRTTGTDRLVVVTLRDPSWRKLDFTSEFADQMGRSYVQHGDVKATYALAWQDELSGIWEVAYTALPESAFSGDVRIVWPGSEDLALHPVVPPS